MTTRDHIHDALDEFLDSLKDPEIDKHLSEMEILVQQPEIKETETKIDFKNLITIHF